MTLTSLDRLRSDRPFYDAFVELLEQRKQLHTDELRRAPDWDKALRAQGKLDAIDELEHLFTYEDREGEQRERHRKHTA